MNPTKKIAAVKDDDKNLMFSQQHNTYCDLLIQLGIKILNERAFFSKNRCTFVD